jgi:hypothetical protein
MGNAPVLAMNAAKIAPERTERKAGAAGVKMEERLFFDRVNSDGGNKAVN